MEKESKEKQKNDSHFTVTLKKNIMQSITLATNCEEIYNKFISAIGKYCICIDFKNDFRILKIIGKGNFAKVYYCI